jgi:hypothetical protein
MAQHTEQTNPDHARLPSFKLLKSQYPGAQRPEEVKRAIGGKLNSPEFVDTCAMRMSWMLNHVNMTIPAPHHSHMLVLSGDSINGHKVWYAIRHAEIRDWLRQTLGPPQISKKTKPILTSDFAGHKGIIALDVAYIQHPGQANATGHIDLWDGEHFSESSEYGREEDTFRASSRVDLWIAPD